jgi:isocitrate lyase
MPGRNCAPHQQDASSAPTRSSTPRAARTGLVRSHRRRRRGRLRGPAQLLRDHEGLYRGGRRRRHFEDQLASEKKCGHLGGKVLIPTQAHIRNLDAARLAADVCGVPTVLVARTDAESARLITSDVDERDHEFLTGERTPEGFFRLKEGTGVDHCIKRGLAFAEHADLIWWETSHPNLEDAKRFAEAIQAKFPAR